MRYKILSLFLLFPLFADAQWGNSCCCGGGTPPPSQEGFLINEVIDGDNLLYIFAETGSNGTLHLDTIVVPVPQCTDTLYRDNYFVYRGDTLAFWEYYRDDNTCTLDSFEYVFCKDTIEGGYLELRTIPERYVCDDFYLENWKFNAPDGKAMNMVGGTFRKVSVGSLTWNRDGNDLVENGGTIIVADDGTIYERQWDYIHVQPEWWEAGGADFDGNFFTSTLSSDGIYNERDRINSAIIVGGRGSVVEFLKNKTYDIDKDLPTKIGQEYQGNNATLRRANGVFSAVTAVAGNTVTVADASQFRHGQNLNFSTGTEQNDLETSSNYLIIDISGNVLTFPVPVPTVPGATASTHVDMFCQNAPNSDLGNITYYENIRFEQINFDGNKANNTTNFGWNSSWSIIVRRGNIIIDQCRFFDTPAENIQIGMGTVSNCEAYSLNGSFVHASNPDAGNLLTSEPHINIINNKVSNYGQSLLSDYGRDRGFFTYSAQNYHVFVSENRVINGENGSGFVTTFGQDDRKVTLHNNYVESAFSIFSANTINNDLERSDFSISGNRFIDAGGIYFGGEDIYEGFSINRIQVSDNIFVNARAGFVHAGRIKIEDNHFYVDEDLAGYARYLNPQGNSGNQNAAIWFNHFDDVTIKGNTIHTSKTYKPLVQRGIALIMSLGAARAKDGAGTDTNYYYAQNVNVQDNKILNFHKGIAIHHSSFQTFNQYETVGWKFEGNTVVMLDVAAPAGSFGIQALAGTVVTDNSVFAPVDGVNYYGIIGMGVDAASPNTATNLGAVIKNNTIRGTLTWSILVGGSGGRGNANNTVLGNCVQGAIRDRGPGNNNISNNIQLDATTLPLMVAPSFPFVKDWKENANLY